MLDESLVEGAVKSWGLVEGSGKYILSSAPPPFSVLGSYVVRSLPLPSLSAMVFLPHHSPKW